MYVLARTIDECINSTHESSRGMKKPTFCFFGKRLSYGQTLVRPHISKKISYCI